MENTKFSESLEVLKDPCLERAKRHSLINIITIAICAVICRVDNFVRIASFGHAKKEWFQTFLELPNGVPSHDIFNDVINRLDQSSFALCWQSLLLNWPAMFNADKLSPIAKLSANQFETKPSGTRLMVKRNCFCCGTELIE